MKCPEASAPAAYALYLAEGVRLCGGPHEVLLQEIGLSYEQLTEPGARMSVERLVPLCSRAMELSGEPGLAFILAAQAPISRFGTLGYACLASATLGDSIALIEHYLPIVTDACRFQLRREGERAVLELRVLVPLGAALDFVVLLFMTVLWQLGNSMTGQALVGEAEFSFPEPDYFARFAAAAGGDVRWNAAGNRFHFDAAYLALPLPSSDPVTVRSAIAQCERELAVLPAHRSIVERVREALWSEADELRDARELARMLGMAERTLKRRLAERDTSYSELLEAERRRRALDLLRAGDSVETISERLGYSDAANFTRAFRRWTGRSPRAFRAGATSD